MMVVDGSRGLLRLAGGSGCARSAQAKHGPLRAPFKTYEFLSRCCANSWAGVCPMLAKNRSSDSRFSASGESTPWPTMNGPQ